MLTNNIDELILFDLPFEYKTFRNTQCVVGENIHPSQKFFFHSDLPTPRVFLSRGLYGTPLTPRNFHDFSTWVPLPLGNSMSINKKTSYIHIFWRY